MQKIKVFALVLAGVLLLAGCGAKPPAEESVPASTTAETPEPTPEVSPEQAEIDAFLKQYADTDARPIAVMVDNDDENARPQAGLEDAYLIYEMVVEGGATRFMALYRNATTEKIGPVRSSRHYFLNYVLENDAIYTHYGWSPKAEEDIPALGIRNINGVESGSSIFWRERKYEGDWHSAYTSMKKITQWADKAGYADTTQKQKGIVYASAYTQPQADKQAQKVTLRYSTRYSTGYTYNADTKLYEKTIGGKAHKMQSGAVVSVKNVLVLYVTDAALGDGSARRELYTTGSGSGYYISEGVAEKITWSKASRGAATVYTKADGTALEINPGKTIINLINPNNAAILE